MDNEGMVYIGRHLCYRFPGQQGALTLLHRLVAANTQLPGHNTVFSTGLNAAKIICCRIEGYMLYNKKPMLIKTWSDVEYMVSGFQRSSECTSAVRWSSTL